MDAVIRTQNLSKVYKDFWGRPRLKALDQLSIEIAPGEVFGILGPNGSGKTTTIKILLGLLFPSEGEASVLGKPPTDVGAKAQIGFLPEESYLYRFLNADETLDFFGRLFHLDRETRKKRADELIELFGLKAHRKRQLKEYSKGMVRRVGFMQALINDPKLVILDEPTSGLDPVSSRNIKDLILNLKRQGKTVFLSSHLLGDVQDVCDRIVILHNGMTKLYGAVRDLLVRKSSVTMTFTDLSDEAQKKVAKLAEDSGARVTKCENTQESLEDIFLRTVQESGDGMTYKKPETPP